MTRRPGFFRAALAALITTLAVASAPAFAQSLPPEGPGEGLLNAMAYRPLSNQRTVQVRPLDNSDENLALKRAFEDALRDQGYRIAEDTAVVLTFEIQESVGAYSSGGERSVLEFSGHGSGITGDTHQLRLNLFDSNRGGLLNEGSSEGTSIVTPSNFQLDVTIDDRTNGRRLWHGWATADLGPRQALDVAKAMVPVLVKGMGDTIRRQPFEIP